MVLKPKYCNKCTIKLSKQIYRGYSIKCHECAFPNANIIVPSFLYDKEMRLRFNHLLVQLPIESIESPYSNISEEDKNELKSLTK